MRTRSPSSRGALRVRFSTLDVLCAIVCPVLALMIRDAYILNTYDGRIAAVLYCTIWVFFSLLSFQVFRLYDGLTDHFSVHDALNIVKAVALTELLTCIVFFTVSRLDGIPRSTPIIHALLLATSLISIRALGQAVWSGMIPNRSRPSAPVENIIMIGANHVSSLYIQLIERSSGGLRRVIALLDDDPRLMGRSIAGTRILAAPRHIEAVIEEFIVHGVRTDRVIVGGDIRSNKALLKQVGTVCERHGIELTFVSQLLGLPELQEAAPRKRPSLINSFGLGFALGSYLRYRRFADPFIALILLSILLPALLIIAVVCLLDVGSPALFWQQRLGRDGRAFLVYKFRTFKAPFDRQGHPIADRKPSFVGRLLRQTRVDELPQLLNVLVGDMALIGPRPLLPEDQPANPATRLTARPGITGWAQVNGGKFLTPEEKDQYDELYIRKATFSFDLRILFMTLKVLLRMNGRSDHQVAAADRVGFGRHPAAFGDSISPPAASTIQSPALSVSGMSAAFPGFSDRTVQSADKLS
jgi:lipopolysaccharide/colanic/teichoic acid biosynthesis glycosyltransferase